MGFWNVRRTEGKLKVRDINEKPRVKGQGNSYKEVEGQVYRRGVKIKGQKNRSKEKLGKWSRCIQVANGIVEE